MQFCRKCGRSLLGEPESCDRCGSPTSIKFKKSPTMYLEVKVHPKIEIRSNNLSTEEDVITNPQDYKHQTFPYAHNCSYGHHLPPGIPIPIAKGKHYCPECGERLRISKSAKKRPKKLIKPKKINDRLRS